MSSEPRSSRVPPRFTWRMHVAVAGTMAALALIVCELLLRLTWHNTYRDDSHEYVIFPNLQQATRDDRINRSRIMPEDPIVVLRTTERNYVLPADVHSNPDVTIAFLGGSTTECVAVREDLRFHKLVSDHLSEHGIKANTLNGARSGNSLHNSLNILLNHVIDDRPDFLVIMHSANDVGILAADGNYRSRSSRPMNRADVVGWVKQEACRHSYLLALFRNLMSYAPEPGPLSTPETRTDPKIADKLPLDQFRERLLVFIDVCRRLDIRPVLMTEPFSGSHNQLTPEWADMGGIDRFNDTIVKTGQGTQTPVIDLAQLVKQEGEDWNKPMNLFYDGIHVTDKGSRVYAKHIAASLLPVVQELLTKRKATPDLAAPQP